MGWAIDTTYISSTMCSLLWNQTSQLNCPCGIDATPTHDINRSFEHRRLIADLIMCYNIIRGHSCIESSSFFTPNHNTTSRGHPYCLSVPLANINVRNHFFSNRIISVWNSLPTELVMSNSTASFKYHLRKTDLSKFLIFATYIPN